jgi:hypothetical protein
MSILQGNQGQAGKAVGQNLTAGFGEFSDLLVTELMARYYEQTWRGNKYIATAPGGGVQLAATHLFSTAIGTFTPILAVYNPITSKFNLAMIRAWCGLIAAPLATITQTGAFLFVCGAGQLITNAQSATPVNTFTLKAAGSQAVGISNAVLAGAVGNPTLLRPMTSTVELVTATANASGILGPVSPEEIAGAIIIPPGGYLAIANGISNAVAGHFVIAGLEWDEIPV